jgi:hypothetical protein
MDDGFAESTFCDFFGDKFGAVDLVIHSNSIGTTGYVGRTSRAHPVDAPSGIHRRLKLALL